MEEEIKQWPSGKVKALWKRIAVTKERDVCHIEICGWGETLLNQKQVIAHSLKDNEKWASDVRSEAGKIQLEKTRLLDQANIMQNNNSDIKGELSNMVANHARAEEETLKINTMAP